MVNPKALLFLNRSLSAGTRAMTTAVPKIGRIEGSIREKLKNMLEAHYVDVINESHMHNVPKGSESHFKVVVVSNKFEGLPLIKRHRLVNHVLEEELKSSVHALSIIAKTPSQWEESEKVVEPSPTCMGGFGK